MAHTYNATNPVVTGNGTKTSDYGRLFENAAYLYDAVPRVLSTNFSNVGNIGAGEDDLMTYTITTPFRMVNDGDIIRARGTFFLANNANNKTIKYKFGATAITVYNNTGANLNVIVELEITRTGAATQIVSGWRALDGAAPGFLTGSPTETLSGDVITKWTGQSGASTTNDVIQTGFTNIYFPHVAA